MHGFQFIVEVVEALCRDSPRRLRTLMITLGDFLDISVYALDRAQVYLEGIAGLDKVDWRRMLKGMDESIPSLTKVVLGLRAFPVAPEVYVRHGIHARQQQSQWMEWTKALREKVEMGLSGESRT